MSDEGATKERAMAEDGKPVTLKAAENENAVFKVVRAVETTGTYGPQLKLSVEGGHVIYISEEKSSMAKGLASGKLKMPFKVKSTLTYGTPTKDNPSGKFYAWSLAPRVVDA